MIAPIGVMDMRAVHTWFARGDAITQLPIDSITPQGYNLRRLDPHVVEDLKRSISATGLLQPIMVRRREGGQFEVVFGNHRLEAARQIGLKSIPALVRQVTRQEAFLLQVTENIQRNLKMNPVGEARGYKELLREGWSIHRIAGYVGKSDSYICDRLRLIERLDPEIQERLERKQNGGLSVSHAEHLSLIESEAKQRELAQLIVQQKLSVRQLEQIVSNGTSKLCICPTCGRFHRPVNVKGRREEVQHRYPSHGTVEVPAQPRRPHLP